MRMWLASPCCVDCGKPVAWPDGFELDHEVPLHLGGEDSEANCRIRCVDYDQLGKKVGCHEAKNKREAKGRGG